MTGDADDDARYRRYLQVGKTITAADFGGCGCKGKGKQARLRVLYGRILSFIMFNINGSPEIRRLLKD